MNWNSEGSQGFCLVQHLLPPHGCTGWKLGIKSKYWKSASWLVSELQGRRPTLGVISEWLHSSTAHMQAPAVGGEPLVPSSRCLQGHLQTGPGGVPPLLSCQGKAGLPPKAIPVSHGCSHFSLATRLSEAVCGPRWQGRLTFLRLPFSFPSPFNAP